MVAPKRAAGRSRSTMPSSVHRSPKKHLKRVLFERRKGESLGLNIKGGKEYKCGIFISAVDQGRQAERKVGLYTSSVVWLCASVC